jgi:hypothetical protein
MAIQNKAYCGTIVFEVDGVEYETTSVNADVKKTSKPVKTMNSKHRALGHSCGIKEYTLKVEMPIPLNEEEPSWIDLENGTITIYPQCGDQSGKATSYTGCDVVEVGDKYSVDKEAMRSLTINALDQIDFSA